MNHTPVSSSNIESIGYDEPTKALHVKFKSGGTWTYSGDDAKAHHDAMLSAPSVGKYFHANVKSSPHLRAAKL